MRAQRTVNIACLSLLAVASAACGSSPEESLHEASSMEQSSALGTSCDAPNVLFANECVPSTFPATLKYVRTGEYLNTYSNYNSVSHLVPQPSVHRLEIHPDGRMTIWNAKRKASWVSYGWYPMLTTENQSYWQNNAFDAANLNAWDVAPVDSTSIETATQFTFKFPNSSTYTSWGALGSYNDDLLYSVPSGWGYDQSYYTWEVTPLAPGASDPEVVLRAFGVDTNGNVINDLATYVETDGSGNASQVFDQAASPQSNASMSEPSQRPTPITNATDKPPYLQFDGSDTLSVPVNYVNFSDADYEIVVVARPDDDAIGFLVAGSGNEGYETVELHTTPGGARFIPRLGMYIDVDSPPMAASAFNIYGIRVENGTAYLRVNGAESAGQPDAGNLLASNLLTLGARGDGTYPFAGALGEVHVFDHSLTAAERQELENELSGRWNSNPGAILRAFGENEGPSYSPDDYVTRDASNLVSAVFDQARPGADDLAMSIQAYQPTLVEDGGLPPRLHFTGVEHMDTSLNFPAQDYEVIVAAERDGDQIGFLLASSYTWGFENLELHTGWMSPQGQKGVRFIPRPGLYIDHVYPGTDTGWAIYSVRVEDGVGYLRVNGSESAGYPDAQHNLTNTGLTIGKRGNATYPFTGDVGEVQMFPRALTTTERSTIEAAMAQRWGVTLY